MTVIEPTSQIEDLTLVAFDLEASGAYPIGSDIVEFGAVKWRGGQIVDQLQFLLKPREPMSDFIIGIHGITNEMVASAPVIANKIQDIHRFLSDAVLFAHHAPFDLGFLAVEFEKARLPFPVSIPMCTSLLGRKLIHDVENHRLPTLAAKLSIPIENLHRALDDAKVCLGIALECVKRMKPDATIQRALKTQEKPLSWDRFSIYVSKDPRIQKIIQAVEQGKDIDLIYSKGSHGGKTRQAKPLGIVRNPDGDYLMALCRIENQNKRFYLEQIKEVEVKN